MRFPLLSNFLLIVVLLLSCEKEEVEQLIMNVDPVDFSISVESGEVLTFNITVKSNVALKRVTIDEKLQNEFVETLKDTTLDTKEFSWRFEYKVPVLESENETLYLYFEAVDVNGESFKLSKMLRVHTSTAEETTESTGHTIYSSASTRFSAFNLTTLTPGLTSHMDSVEMHIVDATDSVQIELSNTWVSPAGLKFVRFNDLDYGNATKTGIKTAYENGLKHDVLYNLAVGDVVLTKIVEDGEPVFYAIKIHDVIDVENDYDQDRYVFNVKK